MAQIYQYVQIKYALFYLVSDEVSLSVFELRQPPGSQSLVNGFGLTGAQVVGAAGGGGMRWREGGGGRDPGVNGAVAGVLSLELCLFWAGGGGGGAGGGQ